MLAKSNINQLIKKCKRKDRAAQKELYLRYADELMAIAIRYKKNIDAAQDLVQETFLTVFNKIDQFDEQKGTPGAWMSRILINHALKDFRKNKKMTFVGEEVFTTQESISTSIVDKLEAEDILKLLEELPEGCRIIFNLKVIEGYTHIEIGEILKITASASRSQLTRAKKLLRHALKKKSIPNNFSKINRIIKADLTKLKHGKAL